MPFVKKIEVKNGILGIWEMTESAECLSSNFHFSENEKVEYQKFNGEKRKVEYLATRKLLQQLLNKKNEITYQKSGRPLLKDSPLQISISHSAQLVTIVISNNLVGIDVENVNRHIDRVTKRFLHPEELAWIEKSENRQFLKILFWCSKEAIFKCSCQAGVQFDIQIFIPPFEFGKTDFFKGKLTTANEVEKYNLWYFYFHNNMIVHCVEG